MVPVSPSREPYDLALLTGARAGEVLTAAVRAMGQVLESWQVHTVHHRPGAGVTVGYSASVRTMEGAPSSEYLCASTARLSNPMAPGVVRVAPLQAGDPEVHVWCHPADPELPALPVACTPTLLSARLGTSARPTMVAYRPTRRAVVRVSTRQGRSYAKVLRPHQAPGYVARHQVLREAGLPVPAVLRHDPDGFVLLEEGRGRALANLLAAGMDAQEAGRVMDNLLGLLDALPASVMQLERRPAWSERVRHYAHAAATALPAQARRTRVVADGVEELMAACDPGPLVPTHGDFYEANILMRGAEVSCLLDVDSVGPGFMVDDLACLLGHVSVLDHLAPATYPAVGEILQVWTRRAEERVDPVALRARCAGVVLSLVSGARREDDRPWESDALGRLARAESWLASAREIQARRGPHR